MITVVTGSRGFVGRALCREILNRWDGVQLHHVDLPYGDLREQETLDEIAALNADVVFHLAAHHFIPWCNAHPQETLDLNATTTARLLEATGNATFVLASSAAVYGLAASPRISFTESDDKQPCDVYGLSKTWAETALVQHCQRDAARSGIAARLFNVVGPAGEDATPHLHPLVAAATGGSMPASLPGLRERRDYVHVDDVARSLVDLAERASVGFTAVNVSSGSSLSGLEMCDLYDVTPIDDTSRHRPTSGHLLGNNAQLRALTGRAPSPPWGRLLP